MDSANFELYHHYLSKRSFVSRIYRSWYLYPRLTFHLHGKVLDAGCGIGDFLKHRQGTIGVDINPFNIAFCKKSGVEAYLIEDDRFPFDDNAFDGAVLDNVLEHLVDPRMTLLEIRRVVKPLGTLVVGVPGHRGFDSDADHKVPYDEAALSGLMKKYGFVSVVNIYMPFRSVWLNEHTRQYCLYGVFRKLS